MRITDPLQVMEEHTYNLLLPLAPTVRTSYPQTLFTGGEKLKFPIVIYQVETQETTIQHRNQLFTRVTCRVDCFGIKRVEFRELCNTVRTEMLTLYPSIDTDRMDENLPGGLRRRSMRFTGKLDHTTGIIYTT